MKALFIYIYISILFINYSWANPNNMDSLLLIINNSNNSEKTLAVCKEFAKTFHNNIHVNTKEEYIQNAISLKKEIKNVEAKGFYLFQLAQLNKHNKSIENYLLDEAFQLCARFSINSIYVEIIEYLMYRAYDNEAYDSCLIYGNKLLINYNKSVDSNFFKINITIANCYIEQHENDKAISHLLKVVPLCEAKKDYYWAHDYYKKISYNYGLQTKYEKALEYMNKAHENAYLLQDKDLIAEDFYFLGLFSYNTQIDSAYFYFDNAIKLARNIPNKNTLSKLLLYIASHYILDNQQYYRVKNIYEELLSIKNIPTALEDMFIFVDIYILSQEKKHVELIPKAINYLSNSKHKYLYEIDVSERLLKSLFIVNGQKNLKYISQYIKLRRKLISFYQESLFDLQTKHKQLQQEHLIQKQELILENYQLQNSIYLFLFFIGAIIGIYLIISFISKVKQSNLNQQNTILKMQEEISALELSMLNKQLDPNEIKNIIDSISPELQHKVPEIHTKMLTLFNITKAALNNSITESLQGQIKQAEDFILLNQKTLSYPLEYKISNHLLNTNMLVEIPRLLLKNIVENAIKHGIKPKKSAGLILIDIQQNNNHICIKIENNGLSNHKEIDHENSTGIGFNAYKKLLNLLNNHNKEKASLDINFLPTSTIVQISIPLNYTYSI